MIFIKNGFNMKNEIYLVANNTSKEINSKFISELKNSEVCHFNSAKFRSMSHSSNKNYLFMHSFTFDGGGYFGINTKEKYEKYYFVSCKERYLNESPWKDIVGKFDKPYENITSYDFDDNYPQYKTRSVGYVGLKYFEKMYDTVYLVGFTFQGIPDHDWEFEKLYAKNSKKVKIIDL